MEVRSGEGPGKVPHNNPHAHVSGKGRDTTVGLNKLPVSSKHPPLSNEQIEMIDRNWEYIKKLIRKVWPK